MAKRKRKHKVLESRRVLLVSEIETVSQGIREEMYALAMTIENARVYRGEDKKYVS